MMRFIILLATSLLPVFLAAQDCVLKKDKDGIKVYTCKSDTSRFRSLQAEFVIENTSIEELKTFVFTVSRYIQWQYNTTEAVMLKKINNQEMIYRTIIDAPWPLDSRELIVQFSTVVHDVDHASFYIKTIPHELPVSDDLVRVPFSQARWDIVRSNNSLYVTYSMNIDPGGYVPPFLVNIAMAEGPYQSFINLKKLIEIK
jgi:hypothetical protein